MKRKADTLYSVAQRAKDTFDRNIDTLVAAFLIRHPDVLPGEIELVMRMGEDRSLAIVIERKGGIQYPDENIDASSVGPEGDAFEQGWRQAIQQIKEMNPPFKGQEMRSEPSGFTADIIDAEVKEKPALEVVGG